ncbi:unnamed protein product [Camellia sinensis]
MTCQRGPVKSGKGGNISSGEAWVLHPIEEVDLLVEETTLHLADEALHLGEAEVEETVHLIFQVGEADEALHLREVEVEEALHL